MAKMAPKEHSMHLFEAILSLKNVDECFKFFEDLCSPTELYAIEQRFDVAKLLSEDVPYVEIIEKTRASSATISRVNRVLNYGNDVLPEIIERVDNKKK